jgi:peroxiredoxin
MNSQNRRDLLATGAIFAGLFAMYVISTHSLAPEGTGTGTSVQRDNDAGSVNQQSPLVAFNISNIENSPAAPDFILPSYHGTPVRLSDAVKKGPVLLDFWATTCGFCVYELPHVSSVYDKYKNRGVQIFAINADTDPSLIPSFDRQIHYDCPVLLDTNGQVQAQYNVTAMPAMVLIDKQMRVRSAVMGADATTERDLSTALDRLLSST